MTDTDDDVLVDDHGYPTEWGLQQLRQFHGTPLQFVDLIRGLWWVPTPVSIDELVNADGKAVVRVRLVTGGWSGNEEVISGLRYTFFHVFYWESSHRGGLHIYEVPKGNWNTASQLGAVAGAAE
jgi:hypothetical protein